MEKTEEDLIEDIIKNQDFLCIYNLGISNNAVNQIEKYSTEPRLFYSDIKGFIQNRPEMWDKIKTINILHILETGLNEKTKENVVNYLMQRYEKEDFYCEDIVSNFFMKNCHSNDALVRRLGIDNFNKIKEKLDAKMLIYKGTDIQRIVNYITDYFDLANLFHYADKGIFTEEKIQFIEQMSEKNKNALRYVNFGLFEDKIWNSLGKDFIEYISKFPNKTQELLMIANNNDELYSILTNKINSFDSFQEHLNEIEVLIDVFAKNNMSLDVHNLSDTDKEELINYAYATSLKTKDFCNEQIVLPMFQSNYKQKINEEYNKRYEQAKNLQQKKNVCLNKIFGFGTTYAQNLIKDFGSDIDNLGLDNEKLQFFKNLNDLININDSDMLDKIFRESNISYSLEDAMNWQNEVSKECALSYVHQFEKFNNKVEQNENAQYIEFEGKVIKQVKLTGDFDIFVHSTDTGFITNREDSEEINYKDQWNQSGDKSNHIISMSFINQNFMGHAPVNNSGVLYGFTKTPYDSIKISGTTDINTYSTEFAYSSASKNYMSAKTLPNSCRRVYNEFAVERNGTVPSYVIIEDDMDEDVKKNSYKAASDFDIPVIYIDKREIVNEQIGRLDKEIELFESTNDITILKDLLNKYETNVAGWLLNRNGEEDKSHTQSIDNSGFKEAFDGVWNRIKVEIDNYIDVNSKEEPDVQNLTELMQIVLEERDLYEDSQKVKPISKTAISYNETEIISKVNQGLEQAGYSNLKVDLDNIPKAQEYKLNMETIIRDALGGKEYVTNEDIEQADKAMEVDRLNKSIQKKNVPQK